MKNKIAEALKAARNSDGRIDIDEAVNSIYAVPGQKFAFLFNQNARRTNLQLAELLALIRQHVAIPNMDRRKFEIEFSTFEEIKTFLEEILSQGTTISDIGFEKFLSEVPKFLENKILIEANYGTACVFLPPDLKLDIGLVCGESGYIHSCGSLLLLRNAEKVSEGRFESAIQECIECFSSEDSRFLLVPYCHEDFTPHDRGTTPFLQHGLDDVKLNISKAFVGATKLYDLLEKTGTEYSDHLVIAPAGDFKKSSSEFESTFPGKTQNTIFLLSDSDLVVGSRFPGSRKFYLMYLQHYKNNNVYHLHDENKPGWASHTTLPHSLAGAMISIARPWFRGGGIAEVADPFGGSGTVFFEAQRIAGINCRSSDKAFIFEYTIRDNSKFFALKADGLSKLIKELSAFLDIVSEIYRSNIAKKKSTPEERLGKIVSVVREWSEKTGGDFLRLEKEDLISGFSRLGDNLTDRLLTYVGLRASVRGVTDLARGTATWTAFFRRELDELIRQIGNQLTWVGQSTTTHPHNEKLLLDRATYSASTSPMSPEIRQFDLLGSLHFEQGSVEQIPRDTYDAIITDPPYGFNTDEDYWEMAAFAHDMIDALILSLKAEGGQLILAAPKVSFSGKGIMPFVRSDYLAREIVRSCARLGRECVRPAVALPVNLRFLQPPYYWVAEKTLERKILHFWIRELGAK